MGKLFGTDGIRGIAGKDLNVQLAGKVGQAAAIMLRREKNHRPRILIGKDTRLSGDMLECALAAGICSTGGDAELLGVLPTPAVAYLVKKYGADAGIVISASHNPAEYNGIKIFGSNGFKISDAMESAIEDMVLSWNGFFEVSGAEIGRVTARQEAVLDYAAFVADACKTDLSGIRVLADCANGAASVTAAKIFEKLHADVTLIHDHPSGLNINDGCGSTHIEMLGSHVVEGGYDMGIAFDGDADRLLMVDHGGELVDGDRLMAILGEDMLARGVLKQKAIVGTAMSNMGLFCFARERELQMVTTQVGDRFVLEAMEENGYNLGGEQSGHLILRDFHTTGDGQLAAVQVLKIVKESGRTLRELASVMETFPQVLENITANAEQKAAYGADEVIRQAVDEWNVKLNGEGRILVRPSGTEPLIRVMVEARNRDEMETCVREIAGLIRGRIN